MRNGYEAEGLSRVAMRRVAEGSEGNDGAVVFGMITSLPQEAPCTMPRKPDTTNWYC